MKVHRAVIRHHPLLAALFLVLLPLTAYAGYLGAELGDPHGTEGETFGVLVVRVRPEGPAAKGGISPHDLIVGVGEGAVESASSLADIVRRSPPGSVISLKILRKGRLIPVAVTLGDFPEDMADHQRGREKLEKGLAEQAITDFTRAIARNPSKADSYFYRAKAYGKQGKYDQAIADYTKAIELNPREISSYGSRGDLYRTMRLYDQAIKDFTKAIEIAPRMALIYVDRGRTYFLKGSYDQAIADCSRAIEIEPKTDNAYFVRADSYERKRMKQEATADLERGAQACIEAGLGMARKGDLDGALRKFSAAVKANTKHSSAAYYHRGVVYEKKADNLKAINDFSEAIRLNPYYAEAYLRRGYVFAEKLKDYNNARRDWEKAATLDMNGSIGQSAKENIGNLKSVHQGIER